MAKFARGKRAYGFCDRCGQRYPLDQLRSEYDTGVSRRNRVCPECYDPDHPQNFLFRVRTDDRESLRDPRPEPGDTSRNLSSWNPVGNHQATSELRIMVGQVTVSIS